MKFTKVIRRRWSSTGPEGDYIGTGITTKDVQMSTGYRGRGKPMLDKIVRAGTPVKFSLKEYRGYTCLSIETYDEFKANHDFEGLTLEEAAAKLNLKETTR